MFVNSHKTQLCTMKYVYYTYYKGMFRPSTAIIRLHMKTSRIYTIDDRSMVYPHTRCMIYGIYTRGFHMQPDDGR